MENVSLRLLERKRRGLGMEASVFKRCVGTPFLAETQEMEEEKAWAFVLCGVGGPCLCGRQRRGQVTSADGP